MRTRCAQGVEELLASAPPTRYRGVCSSSPAAQTASEAACRNHCSFADSATHSGLCASHSVVARLGHQAWRAARGALRMGGEAVGYRGRARHHELPAAGPAARAGLRSDAPAGGHLCHTWSAAPALCRVGSIVNCPNPLTPVAYGAGMRCVDVFARDCTNASGLAEFLDSIPQEQVSSSPS